MRNSLKTTAAAFMLVALTGLTGCATTRDLDTLKAMVEKAQATADAAAAAAADCSTALLEKLWLAARLTLKEWTACSRTQ